MVYWATIMISAHISLPILARWPLAGILPIHNLRHGSLGDIADDLLPYHPIFYLSIVPRSILALNGCRVHCEDSPPCSQSPSTDIDRERDLSQFVLRVLVPQSHLLSAQQVRFSVVSLARSRSISSQATKTSSSRSLWMTE